MKNEKLDIFDVADIEGQILKYLLEDVKSCPVKNFDIKIIKEIGSGLFGVVYLVDVDGKEYVMKEKKTEIPKYRIRSEISGNNKEFYYDFFVNKMGMGEGVGKFEMFKSLNPNLEGLEGEIVLFKQVDLCFTEDDFILERNDGNGIINVNKGSYLCKEEQYSEYYLMLIASTLYNRGVSIHFIDIYAFVACLDLDKLNEYIIMEKLDFSINDLKLNELEDDTVNSIFVQILQAIAAMETLKIVHNDMNPGNIMFKKIDPSSEYLDQSLYKATHFHYRVNKTNIYIPATDYIVKIIDFGLSIKWSPPIVGNKNVVTGDIYESWFPPAGMPNWENTVIDVYRVSKTFFRETSHNNAFINKICSWILGLDIDSDPESIREKFEITSYADNPSIELVDSSFKHVSATNILTNKRLIFPYNEKQKSVTLGII